MLIASIPLFLLYGISILVCRKEQPEDEDETDEAEAAA